MYKNIVRLDYLFKNTVIVSQVCKKHVSVWSADRVVRSPFKDIDIPDVTVSEYVWGNLDKWSDKTAVVCGLTDRKYTYHQLYKSSQCFAASLRKKFQLKDGDTVAVMLPNIPEYPVVALGVLAAGSMMTTLNPVYTAHEVQRQIVMSDTKLIVIVPEVVSTVLEALQISKKKIPIVVVDVDQERPNNTISFKELIENKIDLDILKEVQRKASDIACLPYSSGTTGLPKGVELTNENLVSNSEQQSGDLRLYDETTDNNQDTVLGNLPWFHSYGLNVVMFHKLSVGLRIVTIPKFKPDYFLSTLEKYKCNIFYLAPPSVHFLSTYPGVTSKHMDSMRCVTVGAAPLPMPDIENFLRQVNRDIHFGQAYGLTETSPVATMFPKGYKNYAAVGFALPNVTLRVVNDEMKSLGPNEEGELLIKGPNVTKGYKANDEANKEAFVDGWFRSGDRASIDEGGVVKIADRLKDLIKVKGFQVPPAELESVLKEHPDVFDAAVIGVPDGIAGEKPKAFVVLKQDSKASATNIIDYVSKKVAPYKQIKEMEFVESIPKSAAGKILRRLLPK